MRLKTILNRVQRHKSFVYTEAHLREDGGRLMLDVELRTRTNEMLRVRSPATRVRHAAAASF